MAEETNIGALIKGMSPQLNYGKHLFTTVTNSVEIKRSYTFCDFQKDESNTIFIEKIKADELKLQHRFVTSWITSKVHSSLNAVGLTTLIAT